MLDDFSVVLAVKYHLTWSLTVKRFFLIKDEYFMEINGEPVLTVGMFPLAFVLTHGITPMPVIPIDRS